MNEVEAPEGGSACPVCGSVICETIRTATGERSYCRACFHGWRIRQPEYAYTTTAMCSLGTSAARLDAQIAFFAPFAPPGARVLEIGCATGELALAARAALPLGEYQAIELSPAANHARVRVDKLHDRPLPELLKTGTIEGRFDVIIMSHVLEHLSDPATELEAMSQVLAPDGVIFLEVPNRGGARALPVDDNRSHLHFFSTSSLTWLLARFGLETIATASGVRLDARYSDSLQVMARRFRTPTWSSSMLSDHAALVDIDKVVVWGAGSLAEELIVNYFDTDKIDYFVDRNSEKVGTACLGRPVRSPESIGEAPRTILVNSIDFADSIADEIARIYPNNSHHIVRIGDILDDMSAIREI